MDALSLNKVLVYACDLALVVAMALPAYAENPAVTLSPGGETTMKTSQPARASARSIGKSEKSEADFGLIINEIRIEGNRLVPTEAIAAVIKTHKGDKFDREQVMIDLKAIYDIGYFKKNGMQVDPEVTNSGILLNFQVEENAPIKQISVTGNKVLAGQEISKYFDDLVGHPSNLKMLSEAIAKVEELYKERGFVLAQVSDVTDEPDGNVQISINEGIIDEINITGNKRTRDFEIRHALQLKPGSAYNENEITRDLRKLYAKGYFRDIRRSVVLSEKEPGKFTLKLEIDEKHSGLVQRGSIDSNKGSFGSFEFFDKGFVGRGQARPDGTESESDRLIHINKSLVNGGAQFLPSGRTSNAVITLIDPAVRDIRTSISVDDFSRDTANMVIVQPMQKTTESNSKYSHSLPFERNMPGNPNFIRESSTVSDIAKYFEDRIKLGRKPSPKIMGSFLKAGIPSGKFIRTYDDAISAPKTSSATSFGAMPQFAQYRLGGTFGSGVRGFRSFAELGSGGTNSANILNQRRYLHLPGDKIIGNVSNPVKLDIWANYRPKKDSVNLNSHIGHSSYGARGIFVMGGVFHLPPIEHDFGTPFIMIGDFPICGIGWRDEVPVDELPCERSNVSSALNGGLPWVF